MSTQSAKMICDNIHGSCNRRDFFYAINYGETASRNHGCHNAPNVLTAMARAYIGAASNTLNRAKALHMRERTLLYVAAARNLEVAEEYLGTALKTKDIPLELEVGAKTLLATVALRREKYDQVAAILQSVHAEELALHKATPEKYPKPDGKRASILNRALIELRRPTEALEVAQTMIAYYPDDPFAYSALVSSFIAVGKQSAALQAATEFMRRFPDHRSGPDIMKKARSTQDIPPR